jgi:hypothetical protein
MVGSGGGGGLPPPWPRVPEAILEKVREKRAYFMQEQGINKELNNMHKRHKHNMASMQILHSAVITIQVQHIHTSKRGATPSTGTHIT